MLNTTRLSKIEGTKKLIHRNQLLISLGIPALDLVIGGGLPVGNILLIEEDEFGTYSKMVLGHYLAEGITHNHPLMLCSLDVDCDKLLFDVPAPMNIPPFPRTNINQSSELRIAWRYENTSANPAADKNVPIFGHSYELNRRYFKIYDHKVNIWVSPTKADPDLHNYNTLYEYIEQQLQKYKTYDLPSERRSILRIGLISLGTGLWTGDLYKFLIKLRSLLRNYYTTCCITVNPKLFENSKEVSRVEHLCDAVIQLKSLLNEGNLTYEDYDGLIFLKKLPSVNTWAPVVPETNDWAFKVKKNRFIVEKLHISPELKNPNREDNGDNSRKILPCVGEHF